MRPTEILKQEHRIIELVLSCLDRLADNCEAGYPLDTEAASQAIDFFRVFADQCHHAKEEDLLFPLMESKGFSRQQGPTGVMLHEHEEGPRACAMEEAVKEFSAGDLAGKILFVEHARAYSNLLRQHIQKEDHCLFQMADQTLSVLDQEELGKSFGKLETECEGHTTQEQYLSIAYALADRLGVTIDTSLHPTSCGCSASGPAKSAS